MFTIKWAEHIAFSIPLDFQQDNIVNFRYSTIVSPFAQNLEVVYQYRTIPEGGNPVKNTQFTTERIEQNSTFGMTEANIHKMQNHDIDKTVIHPHTSSTYPLLEHNYAKTRENSQSSISNLKSSTLPAEVAAILPPAYKYKMVKMEHIETECFVGSPKDAFIVSFTIANATNKDDVLKWKFLGVFQFKVQHTTRIKKKGENRLIFAMVHLSVRKKETV